MGLFKNKETPKKDFANLQVPKLPELPKLPDFPGMREESEDYDEMNLPQLPIFPNNSLGNKFSQNTIKEAVAGEKEVESEGADDLPLDFEENENQMMQEPLREINPMKDMRQFSPPAQRAREIPSYSKNLVKKAEPVFIRLDKFEESMEIFNDTKEQISEIENLLKNIKELKQKEDEELSSWENEIQEIRKQIEKVDSDIFSKI